MYFKSGLRLCIRITAVFITLFALSGCGDSSDNTEDTQAKWTLMVYMSGDNDLEEYVVKDLEEELAVLGSNEEVQVIALADRMSYADDETETDENTDWTDTLLFHVTKNMTATKDNAVENWGEMNMADPETLVKFVEWTKENYPADHYAVFFWGHGAGWRPWYNMYDETNDEDTMDLDEMADAFDSIGHVDVVAFDACESQWIEAADAFKNNVDIMAASQEWIDWDGVDYAEVISALQDDPDMSAQDTGVKIAESIGVHDSELTASAVSMGSDMETLVSAVDELAKALVDGIDTYYPSLVTARYATQHFSYGYDTDVWETNIDLYDAVYNIQQNVGDADIQDKCQAVMDAMDTVVLYEWHNTASPEYDNAHGLSIYWPKSQEELDIDFDYYKQNVPFALNTSWDEFCEKFVEFNEAD